MLRPSPDGIRQDGGHSGTDATKSDITSDQSRTHLSNRVNHLSNFFEASNILLNQLSTLLACCPQIPLAEHDEDFEFNSDENKEIGVATGLGLSFLVAIAWFARKELKGHADADEIKQQINPWYRRFKTGSRFGNSLGEAAGEIVSLIFFIPPKSGLKKLITTVSSMIFGLITGLICLALPNSLIDENENTVFRLGRDGWSKYARGGMQIGSAVGAAIGAIIGFLLPIPGGLAAGIAIGGALGAVLGGISISVIVPAYHSFKAWLRPKYKTPAKLSDSNFRTNFMRVGATVGTYAGLLIGCGVGIALASAGILTFGLPLAILFCGTIAAGACAVIGALIFGLAGPGITKAVGDKSSSSWDYDTRTGAMLGAQSGLGSIFKGTFKIFGVGKDITIMKDLIFAVFGLIGSAFGFIFNLFDNKRKSAEDPANIKKSLLPRSQRVGTFASIGGFIGGLIGFAIGTAIGGPIGGPIGLALGTGIAGIICGGIGFNGKLSDKIILGVVKLSSKLSGFFKYLADKTKPRQDVTTQYSGSTKPLLSVSRTSSSNDLMEPQDDEVKSENPYASQGNKSAVRFFSSGSCATEAKKERQRSNSCPSNVSAITS